MCSLCGVLDGADHWADAAPRPGVFTRNVDRLERRRERAARVTAANRILGAYGLALSDWQGSAFLLANKTGKSEIVEDLGHLWPTAERMIGRVCDPLDPALLSRLESEKRG